MYYLLVLLPTDAEPQISGYCIITIFCDVYNNILRIII